MSSNGFLYRQTPNLITIARILLVPLVIWLLLAQWDSILGRVSALIFFVLAASTDGIDGAIARRRDVITNLGKLLDPIADKALLSGALVALSLLGEVSWWATGLILFRELGITLWRLAIASKEVVAASGGGKLKTVIQIVAISFVIVPFEFLGVWFEYLTEFGIWLSVAITLWTGWQYLKAQYAKP